jgi:hypothetical protein
VTDFEEPGPLYGIARLPGGHESVCAVIVVRESPNTKYSPHDWLDVCLPTGALGRIDHRVGAYPFDDEDSSLVWHRPIDE